MNLLTLSALFATVLSTTVSSSSLTLRGASPVDAPTPFPFPVCLLYIDENVLFAFGGLTTSGNITRLIEFKTWADVMNGIDGDISNTTFYVQPGLANRRQVGKYSIPHTSTKRINGGATGSTVATIQITPAKTAATVAYSTLGPVPGHASVPDAIADMNVDTNRKEIVGTVESTADTLFFVIADLYPSNGTVSNVWRDITTEWQTWTWMKYGVSCYNSDNQIYYLVVGVKDVETIIGFPLNGTAPVSYTLQTGYDIYSLRWSETFKGPVIFALDRNKQTFTYLAWKNNAFVPVFSYPTNTVSSLELGQTEINAAGNIVVSTLQSITTNDFLVSYVNIQTGKELARYTLMNPKWLTADISLCDV